MKKPYVRVLWKRELRFCPFSRSKGLDGKFKSFGPKNEKSIQINSIKHSRQTFKKFSGSPNFNRLRGVVEVFLASMLEVILSSAFKGIFYRVIFEVYFGKRSILSSVY